MTSWKNWSLALAITLVAGVGATIAQMNPGSAPGGNPGGSEPEPTSVTHKVERAGILLEVTLDRTTYLPGQLVMAHAVVTNQSGETVDWVGGGCNIPVSGNVNIAALTEKGDLTGLAGELKEALPEHEWNRFGHGYFFFGDPELQGQIACTADIRINQLEPGGKLEATLWWNQQIQLWPEALLAPAGTHTARFSFPLQGAEPFDADPVVLEVPLTFGGERPNLIGLAAAIDAAFANEDVVDWYEAHSGEAVVKQENGKWLVHLPFDGWVEAEESYAISEQANTPMVSIGHSGGNWTVTFFRKMGPPPYQIEAIIDASTGEFLRLGDGSIK